MTQETQKLSDKLAAALEFSNVEIPSHITQNLKHPLRDYQKTALRHYLLQREKPHTNHLMFNMATGSGKTLIMAALMLDCYKRGFREFVFFVDKTAILDKTKDNFRAKGSSKYLFSERVEIDGEAVEIHDIKNIGESRADGINIHFTSIQKLYSVLENERENALSFLDFAERKIVFIADEAHHLNAATKKPSDNEKSWEGTMRRAFAGHKENLMLEFTATIPNHKEVQEKYRDKIAYEYALKEFCGAGFSKRIYLLKYDDASLEARYDRLFLGAAISSVYKEFLARDCGVNLKAVVLFKSQTIAASKENERAFQGFIEGVEAEKIEHFYAGLSGEKKGEVFSDSLVYFKKKFGESYAANLAEIIKISFGAAGQILNVNDENDVEKNQRRLNSLEDSRNEIRAIFAVDKLNEGWDVLNLFDIVRLNARGAKAASKKHTTTAEVQLIGRGARYFPFVLENGSEDARFVRKFDNALNDERAHLERLHYHTLNEVSFIANLNDELGRVGLLPENEKKKMTLKPTELAKKFTLEEPPFYYAVNSIRSRSPNLFELDKIQPDELKAALKHTVEIPLFSSDVSEKEVFKEGEAAAEAAERGGVKDFKDCVEWEVFKKSLNKNGLFFNAARQFEGVKNREDFYGYLGANLSLGLHKKQDIKNRENQLKICDFVLQNVREFLAAKREQKILGDFVARKLELLEREVGVSEGAKHFAEAREFDWLYFESAPCDSGIEPELLRIIDGKKEALDKKFEKWLVVRNCGFEEFKIYGLDEKSAPRGFEPDFVLLAKERNGGIVALECFLEAKGEHLIEHEAWKNGVLTSLNGVGVEGRVRLWGLPFFSDADGGSAFKAALEAFLKS